MFVMIGFRPFVYWTLNTSCSYGHPIVGDSVV